MPVSSLPLSSILISLQARWTSSSAGFQTQIQHLVGDVLLSAGFLSYAGPFNQEYRSRLLELWKTEMEDRLIPFSPVGLVCTAVVRVFRHDDITHRLSCRT